MIVEGKTTYPDPRSLPVHQPAILL